MQKRTAKILIGIAIGLAALAMIYAIAVGVSAAKLRRAYVALEKDGRPMHTEDVIPAKVPDSENAALLYESAVLFLKAQPAPGENLLRYLGNLSNRFMKESLDADERGELGQLLRRDAVTQAISTVEQGAQRPACRFDHDYSAGMNLFMHSVSEVRDLVYIIGAKACLTAEAGRSSEGWDIVQTQLKLADAPRSYPVLVGQLVRMALIRFSCTTIQKLCEIAPPDNEQRQSLDNILGGLDDVGPIIRAMDGERLLLGEWAFNLPKDELSRTMRDLGFSGYDAPGLTYRLQYYRVTFKPTFLADHAEYMRQMLEYTHMMERPYSSSDAEIERRLEGQAQRHMLTAALIPAAFRVKQIHHETTAQIHITATGLALLQYRRARGEFPDSLEALKLKDFEDPFSQGSLLYRAQNQGFVLYSVGPDQKDSGGRARQKNQEEDYDIVWRLGGQQTP